jgi:exosortase
MMRVFLAFYLPLLIAYGDTLKWIWDRWMLGDYYSHGPLLPFVAAAVIYLRRKSLAAIPSGPDLRGWWLLAIGLFLRFCGAAQMVDSLSAGSLLFTVSGVVLLTLGFERFKALLPVIALLAFATPMPMDSTGRIAFELKEIAVDGAVAVGNTFGLQAVREGATIRVPGQVEPLLVADACGGLRSLLALTTLGYCLAFFLGSRSWLRRVVILLLTVPVAVMVNILRIVGLCFMAREVDTYYAGRQGHDIMNIVAWVVNIVILLSLDSLLEKRVRNKRPPPLLAAEVGA